MKYSRSTKYRKKFYKIKLITKILLIWYATIASLTFLTSETSAYYSTDNVANVTIQAASSWWDGSELMFVEKGAENIKACAPIEIGAEIRNVGSDMKTTAVYKVYYVDHGNPKNPHGELVGEGVINPLKHNESTMLTYEVSENGHYMFKAYQVSDYEGSADLEIWSLKIHVNCNAAKTNTNEEDDLNQEIDEEVEESNESKDDEEQTEDEIDEQEDVDEEPTNEEEQVNEDDEPINEEEKEEDEESKDDDNEGEETGSDEDDLDDDNEDEETVEDNQAEEGE